MLHKAEVTFGRHLTQSTVYAIRSVSISDLVRVTWQGVIEMDRVSVPGAVSPGAERPPRTGQIRFAELIYADSSWLRAEFDAIIAANFGTAAAQHSPPSRRLSVPGRERHGHPDGAGRNAFLFGPAITRDLAWRARQLGTRERSPPSQHPWRTASDS
jgi:hypothetical protein